MSTPPIGSRWVDPHGERCTVAGYLGGAVTITYDDGRHTTLSDAAFGMELRPCPELPGQTDIFGGVA